MKKRFLLWAMLIACSLANAQRFEWVTSAGTAGGEYATDIAVMPDGTAYVCGTFSTTIAFGTTTLTPKGSSDAFLAKIDPSGAYLWVQQLAGTSADEANSVAVDASGNVYVAGSFQGKIFYTSTDSSVAQAGYDGYMAKYDPSGVFQWRTSYVGFSGLNDYGKAIAVSNVRGYVYVAYQADNGTHAYVRPYLLSTGALGSGLASIDAATVTVNDIAVRNTSSTNDEVYIVGGYAGNLYRDGGTTAYHSPKGSTDCYFAKMYFQGCCSSGTSLTYSDGGTGADANTSVAVLPSGNYYYAGKGAGTFTVAGQAMVNSGGQDAFVVKYNSTNTLQWAKQGKTNGGYPTGMLADAQENIYLTGYSGLGGFKNGTTTGMPAQGGMIVKLFSNWYIAARTSIGSSSSSTCGNAIALDGQGNIYVAGNLYSTCNFTTTTITSAGASDAYVAKINYLSITSPTLSATKCVSVKDGDYTTVSFKASKKLNSTNTFSLQVDTTSGGDFTTYISSIATVAADSNASMSFYLPRGKYTYAHLRVAASDQAYIGEQTYLYILPKLVAAVTPTALVRCYGAPSTTFTASGSDNGPSTTYTFSPAISGSGPVYSITPTNTTTYTMTALNFNGCRDTVAFTVVVNPLPTFVIRADTSFCPGFSAQLSATTSTDIASYAWSPAAGLSGTAAAVPVASPTVTTVYTGTATSIYGCKTTDIVNIGIYSKPTVDAGPAAYTTCYGAGVTLSATGANSYTWSPTTGHSAPYSGTTTVTNTVSTTYTVTGRESLHGCTNTDVIAVNIGTVSVDAGASSTITCGQSSTLTATPGATYQSPYTYSWSPATGLSTYTSQTTVAKPVYPTKYFVTLTTANGCSATDSVKVTTLETNFAVSFSVTPSQVISLPNPAQFNNNTPSPANYTFYWLFGDGSTVQSNNPSVFHVYPYNGTYDVSLVAVSNSNGCPDTTRIPGYVFVNGGSNCSATASISVSNGLSACQGDSVRLNANTGSGLSYQWMLNGINISGATQATYYARVPGQYAVAVSSGSCAAISSSRMVSILPVPAAPSISASGSIAGCTGGSVLLQGTAGYASYNWSTGAGTQNISVTQTGVYTLTVTNTAGCSASASYTVSNSPTAAPELCIVSNDSASVHPLLVWNKPVSSAIDSFVVYRETGVTNQYARIAAQPYSAFSTYADNSADMRVRSYRYKLALLDTCGNESPMSTAHKTIHLSVLLGPDYSYALFWEAYEGFAVPSYTVFRGTRPDSLVVVDVLADGNTSYIDYNPPLATLYYQIAVENPGGCSPSQKTTTGTFITRSNIAGGTGIVSSVADYEDVLEGIRVMPNPFAGTLGIALGNMNTQNYSVAIIDLLGKTVYSSQGHNSPALSLDLQDLKPGVYYLVLTDANANRFVKKLMKQ